MGGSTADASQEDIFDSESGGLDLSGFSGVSELRLRTTSTVAELSPKDLSFNRASSGRQVPSAGR
jgi:hypothetical protein